MTSLPQGLSYKHGEHVTKKRGYCPFFNVYFFIAARFDETTAGKRGLALSFSALTLYPFTPLNQGWRYVSILPLQFTLCHER